ncbi:MAG: hypothetical protein KDD55_12380, partial [Bdellovibrionales bacterium]|nr:hypothetical protein [Bdellovibrionales bacterium]
LSALFLGVILFIFTGGTLLFEKDTISPEEVFGSVPPAPLIVHGTFQTEEGLIGEIIDPKTNLSISIVREHPLPSTPEVLGAKNLLDAIKAYKLRQEVNEQFGPLLLKYASAHFDSRRAKYLETATLTYGGKTIPAITFHVKFEQFYTIALFEQKNARTLLLAMRPEQPVQQERLKEILRSIENA